MSLAETDSPPMSAGRPHALVIARGRALALSGDGEVLSPSAAELSGLLKSAGVMAVHVPFTWARGRIALPKRHPNLFDLAELFAFVHPARFAAPTPMGLAGALGLPPPASPEDEALSLHLAAEQLLRATQEMGPEEKEHAARVLREMKGWAWAPVLGPRLGAAPEGRFTPLRDLPEWAETPPVPEPGSAPLAPEEARAELDAVTARAHLSPEARGAQGDYAAAVAGIFAPRAAEGTPHMLIAEAGTGVGKTFGYLAPARAWAARNGGTVWVSTYTKNLQRQIAQSLVPLYPGDAERHAKTVLRKGRENYACLLNLDDGARGRLGPVLSGLIIRWLRHTADGDMVGGDFPAWAVGFADFAPAGDGQGGQRLGLTDKRGECIFGACPHYRRCFIEHAQRRTSGAEIVVANHALVLTRIIAEAALPPAMRGSPLPRLILDEGHHLFDAADEAFAARLTAREMADLRRWVRGVEAGRGPARGRTLMERLGDLLPEGEAARAALAEAGRAAAILPDVDWAEKLRSGDTGSAALRFIAAAIRAVRARTTQAAGGDFGNECEVFPVTEELRATGAALHEGLARLKKAFTALSRHLSDRLTEEADTLDSFERGRIDSALTSLAQRSHGPLAAWVAMLQSLEGEAPPEGMVMWLGIERRFGRDADAGLHAHLLDPTKPLAELLYAQAHGVLITSATLWTGKDGDKEGATEAPGLGARRLGLPHLARPALIKRFASPFDYAAQSRVIVVRDVNNQNTEEVASAYRVLFEASGGGGLGLFSAIHRLKTVYTKIRAPLEGKGITLLSQHVDDMDTGTLVDMFRSDERACLLGTDAVRDGVDVPGRSLRLIVFERVPWPRPDILHKARREALGGKAYDEALTETRLAQGYGRLIRQAGDKGVFVILGNRTPTRLLEALPGAPDIIRTGLAEAARLTHEFVGR